MEIKKFILGPIETNAYLLWAGTEAVLVDAPHGAWEAVAPVLEEKGLNLKALLLTHGHWDHIADAKKFQDAGARVYAHADDLGWIKDPSLMNSLTLTEDLWFEGVPVDEGIKEGQVLEFFGEKLEVRHVPGHSPGNVLFYNAAHSAAFVGDVIFAGSIGRHDLPGGDFKTLERSIKEQVYTLPDETVLYTGHGPETMVGREKVSNPFVQA